MILKHQWLMTLPSLTFGLNRGLILASIALFSTAWAQDSLTHEDRIPNAYLAVLDSNSSRGELSCEIQRDSPYLGFDLRFHVNYRVTVPVKTLVDGAPEMVEVFRVSTAAQSEPMYFVHHIGVGKFPPKSRGTRSLAEGFDAGPGRYHVDWMLRDSKGRACSSHWNVEIKLGFRERHVILTLPENRVTARIPGAESRSSFAGLAGPARRIKILLNLTTADPKDSLLKPQVALSFLSMIRSIVREPGVSRLSLIAFNLRAQKIVYEQTDQRYIDFATLRKAIETQGSATIDYRLLQDRNGETHFLTHLLVEQLGAHAASEDAVIILGPKVDLEKKVSVGLLRAGGSGTHPIFYLNYNPNPLEEPFADTISSALKAYVNVSKFDITRPADFGAALRDIRIGLEKAGSSITEVHTEGRVPWRISAGRTESSRTGLFDRSSARVPANSAD